MQEYRAYPAPGTTPDASNKSKSKPGTLTPGALTGTGRIGSPPTSSYSSRIPLPGSVNFSVGANSNINSNSNSTSTSTSNKVMLPNTNKTMGSPNLPPPTKKLRAVAPFSTNGNTNGNTNGTNTNGSAPGASPPPSYVDEKIAQRRAQLQSLKAKSKSSNASAILARAKAVTTANTNTATATATATATGASTTTTKTSASPSRLPTPSSSIPASYLNRSRPIGIPHVVEPPKVIGTFLPNTTTTNTTTNNANTNTNTTKGTKHNHAPLQMNGNTAPAPALHMKPAPVVVAAAAAAAKAPTTIRPPLLRESSSSKRLTLQALREAAASPPRKIDVNVKNANVNVNVKNANGTTNATTTADATANATTPTPAPAAAATTPATATLVGKLVKQKKDTNGNGNGNGNGIVNGNINGAGKVAPPVVVVSKVKETEGTKEETHLEVTKAEGVTTATGDMHVHVPEIQETQTDEKEQEHDPQQTVSVSVSSTQLEFTKRLRLAQQEKEQALKRMAELESQVMNMKFQQKDSSSINITNGNTERNGRGMERDGNRGRGRRRMKSPEPKRDGADPLKDLNVASRAVETVVAIFMSPSAKFVVRKPYGGDELKDYCFVEEHENENEDGSYTYPPVEWAESVEGYWKNSNVKDEQSLEVLAKVEADGSILHIHGNSCRHGLPVIGDNGSIMGYEFKTFADVEDMDGALGKVIFIDSEGNDEEYWLDPIYEEALKIRESYCSNVFSAASALASEPIAIAKPMASPTANGIGHAVDNAPPTMMMPPAPAPAVVAASVDKDPKMKENMGQGQPAPQKQAQKEMEKPKKQQEKEQPQHEDSGSTDILSFFFIWFFSTLFKIVWFILMIPVRVVKCTLTIGIVVSIAHLLWLYLADNRDAMDMGALMSNKFNIN